MSGLRKKEICTSNHWKTKASGCFMAASVPLAVLSRRVPRCGKYCDSSGENPFSNPLPVAWCLCLLGQGQPCFYLPLHQRTDPKGQIEEEEEEDRTFYCLIFGLKWPYYYYFAAVGRWGGRLRGNIWKLVKDTRGRRGNYKVFGFRKRTAKLSDWSMEV